jgi:hypothetical protein
MKYIPAIGINGHTISWAIANNIHQILIIEAVTRVITLTAKPTSLDIRLSNIDLNLSIKSPCEGVIILRHGEKRVPINKGTDNP